MEKIVRKQSHLSYQVFIFLAFLIAAIVFFFNLPRLMVPLGVAYVLALMLEKLLPFFVQRGLSRGMAIFILFLGLFLLFAYPLLLITPVIEEELINLQRYLPALDQFFKHFATSLSKKIYLKTGLEIHQSYFEAVISWGNASSKELLFSLPNILASLFEWVLLIPLFLFFILRDGQLFKRNFFQWVPNPLFERTYYIFHQFDKQLGDYIFAKFIEGLIIAVLCLVGLLIINLRFAWLLAITAGVASIIPYLGPIIGAIPAIVICLIDHGAGPMLGAVFFVYSLANVIDLGLVFPLLVSKIVNLHPIIVVMSVIIGSQYMGMVGMIISVPAAAILKLIFSEIFKEMYPIFGRNLSDSTK